MKETFEVLKIHKYSARKMLVTCTRLLQKDEKGASVTLTVTSFDTGQIII